MQQTLSQEISRTTVSLETYPFIHLSQCVSLVGGEKFCILLFLQQFIDNFPLRSETMSDVTNCYCIYVFWLFHQSLA